MTKPLSPSIKAQRRWLRWEAREAAKTATFEQLLALYETQRTAAMARIIHDHLRKAVK